MTLMEIALISIATGFVLSGLCLAFCRLGLDIIGGLFYRDKTLSEFTTVALQAIVSLVIVSFAVIPLYAIVQARFDIPSIVLGGPLMGMVGMLVFIVGGGYRWGKPPEYMWSVLGCFVLFTGGLNVLMGYLFA